MYKKFKLELQSYNVNYNNAEKIIATAHYHLVDNYNSDAKVGNWSTNIDFPLGSDPTASEINKKVLALAGVVATA